MEGFTQETGRDCMRHLLDEISKHDIHLILAVGAADTGKTTLVAQLADRLSRTGRVGLVDADIGQSHLGPPSTVAWGNVDDGFSGWEHTEIEDLYFTGAISPPGNLLQLLTGSSLMVCRARESCDKVIVDTTGLVSDSAGRTLKQQKIDLLKPDMIIALQRENELEEILAPLRFQERPTVFRVPAAAGSMSKSASQRAAFRAGQYNTYFSGAGTIALTADKVGLRFMRGAAGAALTDAAGRLVSLRDAGNNDLALGIILAVSEHGTSFEVLSPLSRVSVVTSMVIGDVHVPEDFAAG